MAENHHPRSWLAWIALIGFSAVVAGYYIWHKPITPDLVVQLARAGWALAVSAALISLAGGLGRRLLPRLDEFHPLARLALQAGLGAGCLALGVLAAGFAGLFYPWVGLSALGLAGFFLRREIIGWWSGWGAFASLWQSSSRVGKFAALLLLSLLAATLFMALAPPVKFDTLVYHLTLPQIYLRAHRFIYVPEIMFWGMPQTAEMLTTWGSGLAGLSSGPALGWLAGVVALAGLLGLTARATGADAGWMGAAALMSGYTAAAGLSWGYVEWWTMLFGLGFLAALTAWVQTSRDRLLGLAGLMAGFALGTKYTAGILLGCGLAVILFQHRGQPRRILKSILWFGLPAVWVFSPWLVKNLASTGNPVYPFFIPSGAMTAFRQDLYQSGQPWGNWLDVLFLPVRASILGVEGAPGYSASIGPLLLGLSLAVGIRWKSRPEPEQRLILTAGIVLGTGFLVWMTAGRFSAYLLQSRLYMAVFPAWAALAAAGYAGFARLTQNGVRIGVLAGALTLLALGLNAVEIGTQTIRSGAVPHLTGAQPREDFLAENLGWFAPAMAHIRELSPDSRVLLLWEPRSLYCLPRCEPDEILDRWLRERYDSRSGRPASAEDILSAWRMQGTTHILYYRLGAEFLQQGDPHYRAEDWLEWERMLDLLEVEAEFGDSYLLLKVPR